MMQANGDLPSVVERFLRYVKIDTKSDPESDTTPSTEIQKDLSRLLAEEVESAARLGDRRAELVPGRPEEGAGGVGGGVGSRSLSSWWRGRRSTRRWWR